MLYEGLQCDILYIQDHGSVPLASRLAFADWVFQSSMYVSVLLWGEPEDGRQDIDPDDLTKIPGIIGERMIYTKNVDLRQRKDTQGLGEPAYMRVSRDYYLWQKIGDWMVFLNDMESGRPGGSE